MLVNQLFYLFTLGSLKTPSSTGFNISRLGEKRSSYQGGIMFTKQNREREHFSEADH